MADFPVSTLGVTEDYNTDDSSSILSHHWMLSKLKHLSVSRQAQKVVSASRSGGKIYDIGMPRAKRGSCRVVVLWLVLGRVRETPSICETCMSCGRLSNKLIARCSQF